MRTPLTLAKIVEDPEKGNMWECALCHRRIEFLSITIAHLFLDHKAKSLTQSKGTTEVLGVLFE